MLAELDRIEQLLDKALEQMDISDEHAVGLEGSLAQAYGNSSSDIDFLVLDCGPIAHPTMPTVLFIDGKRIEIRVRSIHQARTQIAQLLNWIERGRAASARIPEDLLDRCQRLCHVHAFKRPEHFKEACAELSDRTLANAVRDWFGVRAERNARMAVAMYTLGDHARMRSWLLSAITCAAQSWAAKHGETYIGTKWLAQKLTRISDGAALLDRLVALRAQGAHSDRPREHLAGCLSFVADSGLLNIPCMPAALRLERQRQVTTWRLANRVHVVRNRQHLYTLGDRAAAVWQTLRFGIPLIDSLRGMTAADRAAVARFHQLGLISLRWDGAGTLPASAPIAPPGAAATPLLSLGGAVLPQKRYTPYAILPIPLAAQTFASAGVAHVWANLMIENSIEDVRGALHARQWSTLQAALTRLMRETATAVITACGVYPLPPVEEICLQLQHVAALPRALTATICEISLRAPARNVSEARASVATALQVATRVRRRFCFASFPASFKSARAWQATLELGYDWARMAAYLNATFPLEEVREMLCADFLLNGAAQESQDNEATTRRGRNAAH